MLQFIRTSAIRWLVIPITFFFFFLITGCDSIIYENSIIEKNQTYSDTQIFNGVFFGKGKVAKLFPEIWEKNFLKQITDDQQKTIQDSKRIRGAINSSAYQKATSNLFQWIQKEKPKFLKDFGNKIRSGNPQIVQSTIERGAALLAEAAEAQIGHEVVFSGDVQKIYSQVGLAEQSVDREEACLVLAVAVAAYVAVVHSVAYYLHYYSLDEESDAESTSKLKYETMISLFTDRLESPTS